MKIFTVFLYCFLIFDIGWASSNADWMDQYAEHIQDKSLKDVFLPGSHDSATYALEDTFGKNQNVPAYLNYLKPFGIGYFITYVTKQWAKAQDQDIYQQLKSGVRYLDLRVIFRDSLQEFYTAHSLYGPSLKNILKQISQFLQEHPREILVIEAGDLRYMPKGDEDHKVLIEEFQKTFGEKLAPRTLGPKTTIKEFWEKQKQVVLIYNADNKYLEYSPNIWSKDKIDSYWANQDTPVALKKSIDEHMETFFKNRSDKLYVVQSQMTVQTQDLIDSLNIFTKHPDSLKDFSQEIDKNLQKWLKQWASYHVNIILLDFVSSTTSKQIINLNKRF